MSNDFPTIHIIFGCPGAGKTTIAIETDQILDNNIIASKASSSSPSSSSVLLLDLDTCVPQWMRDNFNIGIYPTVEERCSFAIIACQYVKDQYGEHVNTKKGKTDTNTTTTTIITNDSSYITGDNTTYIIISFSFVNEDIRQVFQQTFTDIVWILIDTDPDIAQYRFENRTNHFYKSQPVSCNKESDKTTVSHDTIIDESKTVLSVSEQQQQPPPIQASSKNENNNKDTNNSDWDFAPITFQHYHKLNGVDSIETNA